MKHIVSALTLAVASTLAAAPAAAEGRLHDGFFLRLSPLLGPLSVSEEISGGGITGPETTISGFGMGGELLLGGTVAPGLVIGGGLFSASASDPEIEAGSFKATANGSLLLAGVHVFGNYYLNPAEGLYLQALLGFGAIDFVNENGTSGGNDPTGPMLGIGVGYDFWVADQWSIGPFGRLIYGSFSAENGAATADDTALYPHLGVGITFH